MGVGLGVDVDVVVCLCVCECVRLLLIEGVFVWNMLAEFFGVGVALIPSTRARSSIQ